MARPYIETHSRDAGLDLRQIVVQGRPHCISDIHIHPRALHSFVYRCSSSARFAMRRERSPCTSACCSVARDASAMVGERHYRPKVARGGAKNAGGARGALGWHGATMARDDSCKSASHRLTQSLISWPKRSRKGAHGGALSTFPHALHRA